MGGKPKRRYSDQDRANALAALAANGANVERTARQLGLPAATLRAWSTGSRHPEAVQAAEGRKRDLADQLEALAYKLIEAVRGKLAGASLAQLMIALGIAIDKMVLLRREASGASRGR